MSKPLTPTPGPWIVERIDRRYEVANEETLFTVATCSQLANAQLIAAAPELLAILVELTNCYAPVGEQPSTQPYFGIPDKAIVSMWRSACEAIAKAKGE